MFRKFFSLKKLATVVLAGILLALSYGLSPAFAGFDPNLRVVALNDAGDTLTLSNNDLIRGKRLFNGYCASCHVGGQTNPNPDVSLNLVDLQGANPPRDNVMAMVDYLNNPTTYDGAESFLEFHPNTQLKSAYPKMQELSQDDLKIVSAYILVKANTTPGWGGSKSESHSDLSGYL
jgi:photosystem II cytochrome c550